MPFWVSLLDRMAGLRPRESQIFLGLSLLIGALTGLAAAVAAFTGWRVRCDDAAWRTCLSRLARLAVLDLA